MGGAALGIGIGGERIVGVGVNEAADVVTCAGPGTIGGADLNRVREDVG